MKYRPERTEYPCKAYKYSGYIDDVYAGYVIGFERHSDTFDIRRSELEPDFRGRKSVRAFSEMMKVIQGDYDNIVSRIDNRDNGEIKIVLSAGFHIIGTVVLNGEIYVELLKTKEGK